MIVIPMVMAKIEAAEVAATGMEVEGLHLMEEETIGTKQVLMTALGKDDLLPSTGTRYFCSSSDLQQL